jgi:hypothetical protein
MAQAVKCEALSSNPRNPKHSDGNILNRVSQLAYEYKLLSLIPKFLLKAYYFQSRLQLREKINSSLLFFLGWGRWEEYYELNSVP